MLESRTDFGVHRRCGCKDFRVIYTRWGWGGKLIRRWECRHCAGYRIDSKTPRKPPVE